MSLPIFQRTVVDDGGNVQPSASVTVLTESTGLAATIYSDRDGLFPITQPLITGIDGLIEFYADSNEYRIDAVTGSGSATWRYVIIGNSTVEAMAAADEAEAAAAAALASEGNAATSETNASNSETNASNSETAAGVSETNAGVSETNAGNSETAAGISETNAGNSETSAANDAAAADATLKNFETKYLGEFAVAPTLDNEGNALTVGAAYWSTVTDKIFIWGGSAWAAAVTGGTAATYDVGTAAGEIPTNSLVSSNSSRFVTVGSGGTYSTLNEALTALSGVRATYVNGGFTAIIEIKTGTVIPGFTVSAIDLGWVTLTSESGAVDFSGDISIENGAVSPKINMNIVDAHITVEKSSEITLLNMTIELSTGVGGIPLTITKNSSCFMEGVVTLIKDNGDAGVLIQTGSTLTTESKLSLNSSIASFGIVSFYSTLNIIELDLVSSLWTVGLDLRASTLSSNKLTLDGCDVAITAAEGSEVRTVSNTVISNYRADGVRVSGGSRVSLSRLFFSGTRPVGGSDIDLISGSAYYDTVGTIINSQADGVYNSNGYIIS